MVELRYIVSLLKAYYGETANRDNDWGLIGFASYGTIRTRDRPTCWTERSRVCLSWDKTRPAGPTRESNESTGQTEVACRARFGRAETASFVRLPEVERGELRPQEIATEVFFFLPPGMQRKMAASPTRSVCFSGTKKPSILREMRGVSPGSCTNWVSA